MCRPAPCGAPGPKSMVSAMVNVSAANDAARQKSASAASLAGLFRVLGDETRLRIFALLTKAELCVCEIEDLLGLSQSLVSNHLGVLRRAGLVESRRDADDARWIFYRASPAGVALLRERCEGLLQTAPAPPNPRRAQAVCRMKGR